MSKKKKSADDGSGGAHRSSLLACAAFYIVFDVPNWQKLDASKLSALAQTSSMYDAQGELMSELRGAETETSYLWMKFRCTPVRRFWLRRICALRASRD